MAANVSGTVLSSLFYDQTSCPGDQEGYLLGKIINHVQDKISDSQISSSKVETVIYIYSYLPWPSEDKFYNASGRVNPTKAITLLKGKHQDLIGWYKFRRNSTLRPSLRESNLHNSLLESLPVEQDNNFLFFLCSSSLSYNKATHTFDHILLRRHNGKFQKVTMSVINLGDTTHTEYKSRGNLTVNPTGASLQTVIDQFQKDFVSDSGGMFEIGKVRGLSTTLHSKLQGLCGQVEKSEVELSALEQDVKLMSYRLLEQEEMRKAKRKAEEKAVSPTPQLVIPSVTSTISPTMKDSHKLGGGRSDHRLRVGETGRRPRQISIEDDEVEREEAVRRSPETSLIDFEIGDSASKGDILEPVTNSMEVDRSESKSERTSRPHKTTLESVVENSKPEAKQSRTRGTALKKADEDAGNDKPADAFSFVSSILDKEKESLLEKTPANPTSSVSHEVGKPTAKREINSKTNSASVSSSRRPQSRAEAQAMRSRKTATGETVGENPRSNSPSIRTRQPGPSQAVASTSEVKGERSRPQRIRQRPGPAVRSRSRESPPGNQRLGTSSVQCVSRTKSASPSNCRTPVRKVPLENGTDSSTMIDDSKLSSSPVF